MGPAMLSSGGVGVGDSGTARGVCEGELPREGCELVLKTTLRLFFSRPSRSMASSFRRLFIFLL